MMRLKSSNCWLTASAIALLYPGLVYAQAAPPPKGGAASGASTAAGPPAPPPQSATGTRPENGISEIIVTAEKRSQNVQKTPAAVTAITGVALTQSGLTDLRKVQEVVPGARFQQEGNSTQVFLRGVGSNLDFANIEQSVSFLFNGIYVPREATSVPLFDLERLEVLPGPQGTLYGRSAIGGTINVAFQRPTHQNETVGVFELGNYDLAHLSLAQNMAVRDDLAIRAAIDYTYRDGYMATGADSQSDLGLRLSALYEPTSAIKAYVWTAYNRKFGHPPNLVNKGLDLATGQIDEDSFLTNRPWDDRRTGALAQFAPFGQPVPPDQTFENWTMGGEFDVQLGHGMTLTYIPGYTYLRSDVHNYWLGGIPARQDQHYHSVSQELRLSGTVGRLDYLVGLYGYQSINSGLAQVLYNTPAAFYSDHVQRDQLEGLALYGQGTYHVSDRLRVTFGGRYGADNRNGRGISLEDQVTPFTFAKTFYHTDYKIGAEYDLAPRILTYVTYQTGYQPGTFNEVPSTPQVSNLVKDATLSSISGGIKTRFFDNRLQINDEIFYYDYSNLFIQSYDASKAYNQIFNAKSVTIPGNQLDIIYKPTPDDRLSAAIGYLHARNEDFVTPQGQNYNGLLPPYAADWTATFAFYHDFHFATGYVRAGADTRFESQFYADYIHNPGTRQSPAFKENADLTYYPDRGNWTLGVWIKNITDKATIAATAAAGIPGPGTAYLEPPRTFGGRLTFKY